MIMINRKDLIIVYNMAYLICKIFNNNNLTTHNNQMNYQLVNSYKHSNNNPKLQHLLILPHHKHNFLLFHLCNLNRPANKLTIQLLRCRLQRQHLLKLHRFILSRITSIISLIRITHRIFHRLIRMSNYYKIIIKYS